MPMKSLSLRIGLTLFCMVISVSVFGQGTIHGVVSDSTTAKPLVGANVYLLGTALGSASDFEGEYRITQVPPGQYTLRISYIGYKMKDLQITVQYGQTMVLNVALVFDVIEGKTIQVTAQAEGQVAAINQQITSSTIINVVSEEKIQELPDANAAEAIGRLPGISLRRSGGEANKIILRGLSDKFSAITVDGVRIAPTDADSRGVDLSTVSQGSLAGIELFKALTPDKDADAIAGSVNLVTKKAPSERLLRLDSRGSYNQLADALNQYDFVLRYGERFFNDFLGVQLTGNLEQRDRSNEHINLSYNIRSLASGKDYDITDFEVNYTDELRDRKGLSLLLDLNTPEGGSVKISNIYNKTKRDYIQYSRNYPTDSSEMFYGARDREQEIDTYTGSVTGENYFFGLISTWGFSYARSRSDFPFDYDISYIEPSSLDNQGNPISHMRPVPEEYMKGPPESIISCALNNFEKAHLYTAYYREQANEDREKTAFLNIAKEYILGTRWYGEIKAGGKYRNKSRSRLNSELLSPYYNEPFPGYVENDDGTVSEKNFGGTRFADLKTVGGKILVTNFLDAPPVNRSVYDKYDLYPIVNRAAVRQWWDLNRNGFTNSDGSNPEYERNLEADAYFYDIADRVSSAYVMNTLNFGQSATLIAGLRVESEDNDYASRYSPKDLSGFPVPTGIIRDTSAVHKETVWLPNSHLTIRPTDFMNLRFAAYKALARPDFNHRLESFVARKQGTFYSGNTIYIGNPGLRAAQAWNYEINSSFFGRNIGLFSISAFYKDVKDMFHLIDGLQFSEQSTLDSLGISYDNPFENINYILTYPYNSTKPTRIWGLELEHQANLRFLPGLFKNIVLSYNLSLVRSETYIPMNEIETYEVIIPGFPFPVKKTRTHLIEKKQKLEGQPEFFGNFSVGYDIGGFSARLSVFHQGGYNRSFSPDGRSDVVVDRYTRWDLAIKHQITRHIAVMMNVNNFTDVEESTSIINRVEDWNLLNNSEKYGMTADLGLRLTL